MYPQPKDTPSALPPQRLEIERRRPSRPEIPNRRRRCRIVLQRSIGAHRAHGTISAIAMLRSAVGLALRQSAPAARFCGKVGRRNPASNITTSGRYLNYDASRRFEFSKENFAGCTGVEFMIGAFACGVALLFRHYTTPPYEKESRYNTASCETKSTSDTCQHGQHGLEKME
ncbi:uncharacterized protein LOC119357485 [Triticum dicoccoides]|uniref:uncharacterized protein LOC119357485 n=1 Tax=Triticum dicoccoides TaxID=85692 RepID=UPI00188FEA0D|nr:uncharacterized protein LOC119357485 [Triticum dicoccoides]